MDRYPMISEAERAIAGRVTFVHHWCRSLLSQRNSEKKTVLCHDKLAWRLVFDLLVITPIGHHDSWCFSFSCVNACQLDGATPVAWVRA